jgi:hypothetical protein
MTHTNTNSAPTTRETKTPVAKTTPTPAKILLRMRQVRAPPITLARGSVDADYETTNEIEDRWSLSDHSWWPVT